MSNAGHDAMGSVPGIFHQIGSQGGTRPWENPVDLGLIRLTASSLLPESDSLRSLLGTDPVRCVTRPQPQSWIMVDLLDKQASISSYSLRHCSSWDLEALRNWRLEGTENPDLEWHLIMEHNKDTSLSQGSHTWQLPEESRPFRAFRILQTGLNANNNHFLTISGIELYGRLFDGQGQELKLAEVVESPREEMKVREYVYTKDFDANGIVYALSTAHGTKPWRNACEAGLIDVRASTVSSDSLPPSAVVGTETIRFVTRSLPSSWVIIDFKELLITPSCYTLRHYSTWDVEALRHWRLEGSLNGSRWTTLREHVDDTSLNFKGATASWNLQCSTPYHMFRILQTGLNSNGHQFLSLSGFEIYGKVSIPQIVEKKTALSFEEITWDPKTGPCLEISGAVLRNTGTTDKWQMARSAQAFETGVHVAHVKIICDPKTTNSWRFILGAIPSNVDCRGSKQWVGTGDSWGFIAGTGGKCHSSAKSLPYGSGFGIGDTISILLDLDQHHIEFFVNGQSQGIAFEEVEGPVHFAVSLTAHNSALSLVQSAGRGSVPLTLSWDPVLKGSSIAIDPVEPHIAVNGGLDHKWQSVQSSCVFYPENDPRPFFQVEILKNPPTNNRWQLIVGVAPQNFAVISRGRQWVGAADSWGYIAGTGGKCASEPKSIPYGAPYGVGDVIGVQLDFVAGTIEFFKNRTSQGIAFENLKGPVVAAVSLTAADASVALSHSVSG